MLPIRVALLTERGGRRDIGGATSAPLLGALLVHERHLNYFLVREEAMPMPTASARLLAEPEHLLEALKGLADLGTGPEAADAALRQALDLAAKSGESRGLQTARDAMGDDMDEAGLAKLAGALRSSRDARVLCRTRGGLERLLARLGSRPTKDAGSIELHVDGFDLDDDELEREALYARVSGWLDGVVA